MSDDQAGRLYLWCMGLLFLAAIFFQTPAGPIGLPIAVAGVVCGVRACRADQ